MQSLRYYWWAFRDHNLCLYVNPEVIPSVSLIHRDHLVFNLGRYYSIMSSRDSWTDSELLQRIMNQRSLYHRVSVVSVEDDNKFIQFYFVQVFPHTSWWNKFLLIHFFGSRAWAPTVNIDFPLMAGKDDPVLQQKLEVILQREGFVPDGKELYAKKLLPYYYTHENGLKILQVTCLYFPDRAIKLSLAILHELLNQPPDATYEVRLFAD